MLSPFEDVDRFFEDFFPARTITNMRSFVPLIDVYQDKDNVIVEAQLPGIDPKNVSVSVENDVLTIEGKSERTSEVEDTNYYRKEVRYGSFHRAISLPVAVNGNLAKATYGKGILKIVIPKEERAKPKQVAVQVNE